MKTKIIATIGPASFNLKTLNKMKKEGMRIARINTKYATIKEILKLKQNLNKIKCELLIDVLNQKKAELIKELEFDYLALSFTESSNQIKKIRKLFKKKIFIISKIETRKGVRNIKEIIKSSDGIMVARGDLSNHVRLEALTAFQKKIIKESKKKNKFVITATEMLLSMTKNTKPTKAEVSDVTNAVLDGSNALMLSEETAIGKHPIKTIKIMKKIIKEAEKIL